MYFCFLTRLKKNRQNCVEENISKPPNPIRMRIKQNSKIILQGKENREENSRNIYSRATGNINTVSE
jgi:hypothetical protein